MDRLVNTTSSKLRYVVAPKWDEDAYGIPVLAQSVAYLTHALTPAEQDAKNIHYAREGEVIPSDRIEIDFLPW